MGKESDRLRIMQEIEIWPYEQMVHAQPSILPWKLLNWDRKKTVIYTYIFIYQARWKEALLSWFGDYNLVKYLSLFYD